jgi:predicted membrane channel-forming protein YqfA (hemolysin III family)
VYFAGAGERTKRMAMKETVRSLRAYFILSGVATLISYGRALWVNFQGPFKLPTAIGVIGIGFSVAFLYVGINLPRLLRSSASRVVTLLYVSTGWVVFVFLLGLREELAPIAVVTLLLSLLILWYLLKNIRRLATEAQASSAGKA